MLNSTLSKVLPQICTDTLALGCHLAYNQKEMINITTSN